MYGLNNIKKTYRTVSDRHTRRKLANAMKPKGLAAPMAALICTWMERGIQVTTIHEALVERYGFTGGYDSVKCFIRRNKKAAPATVFINTRRS